MTTGHCPTTVGLSSSPVATTSSMTSPTTSRRSGQAGWASRTPRCSGPCPPFTSAGTTRRSQSGAKALGTSSGGPICGDQAAAPWLVGGRRPTRGGPRWFLGGPPWGVSHALCPSAHRYRLALILAPLFLMGRSVGRAPPRPGAALTPRSARPGRSSAARCAPDGSGQGAPGVRVPGDAPPPPHARPARR